MGAHSSAPHGGEGRGSRGRRWQTARARPVRGLSQGLSQGLSKGLSQGLRVCLVWVLSLTLVLQPVAMYAQAVPDISIQANAPTLDAAPNGVPVVNIVAPSAAGVSHNRFQSLSIEEQGMIFNNAQSFGTSQLGGVVLANPNLKTTNTARIILNEVTGTDISALNGFAEIFGDRAQFVLANPNGITCSGCGFINMARTTLTTGTPSLSGGDLDGIDVDGPGLISIEDGGLNAEDAEALDLLARTIRINGRINARDLRLFAGRNLMDYGARVVTRKADDGSTLPALAIDGTLFGAMYADRITVIATEDGVGVRLPDDMATGNGDFTITADGRIELTDVTSAGRVDVVSNGGEVAVGGTVTSQGDLTVDADSVTNNGDLVAGQDSDAMVVPGASLGITAAGDIVNTGRILASSNIDVESMSGSFTNRGGVVNAQDDLGVRADIIENDEGALLATGDIVLSGVGGVQATRVANRSGVIETRNGDITINALDVINARKGGVPVTSTQTYSSTESTTVSIAEAVADGASSAQVHYNTNTALRFTVPGDDRYYYLDYGPITVRQYTDGVDGDLTAPAYISSGGALTINAGTIQNDYSHISSAGDMALTGTTLNNVGQTLETRITLSKSSGLFNRPYLAQNGASTTTFRTTTTDSIPATIRAGGALTGSFTGQIDNDVIAGSVAAGDLIPAHTIQPDTGEAPSLAELAEISLTDVYELLPARDALTQVAAPEAEAAVETRTRFAAPSVVLGSSYFLSRVNLDTNDIPDRFAFTQALEERLVETAIRLKAGRRWLDPTVQDASLQLQRLLDAGIAAQSSLQLVVGVSLTADQISRLNQSIVWYVEETINGERVLAPRLYLSAADAAAFVPKGATLAGASVDLDAATISTSGDIVAGAGDVDLTTTGDLTIESGRIEATGDARLTAGGALSIVTDTRTVRALAGGSQTLVGRKAWVSAGGAVELGAADDLVIAGADVSAGGDTTLQAGGHLVIGAVQVNQVANVGPDTDYDRWQRTTNRGSSITSGGALNTASGSDTLIQASTLRAGTDIGVSAGGDVSVLSARDTFNSEGIRRGGKKSYTLNTVTNIRPQILAGGNVVITASTGDITTRAARLRADGDGGTVTLDAGQGQVALLSATDETRWTYKSSSSNALTYKMRDAGAVDTTVLMTEVHADGGLVITVAPEGVDALGKRIGGVRVEIRDGGSLEANINTLSQTPGLEYLADLARRDDVDWQQIREIHDSWDYRAQGLSGPAAAVIAIAVTAATQGMGAKFAAAFAAKGTATALALQAGFSSLVAQAATSLAVNGGDLGATLKGLASSETLRGLATSMLTAGLMPGIGEATGIDLSATDLAGRVQTAALRMTVNTAVQTTIGGQDPGDALKTSLIQQATQVIGAELAEGISDAFKETEGVSKIGQYIAHAALGCGIGAAGGGSCQAGAGGAVVGELAGEIYFSEERQKAFGDELQATISDENLTKDQAFAQLNEWRQQGVNVSRLAAALAVAIAGGDENDVNVATQTSANAVENNLCGTGLCIISVTLMIQTAYAFFEGDGNIITGVDKIIAGEDTLNRVVQNAAQQGVELAYAVSPEATEATIQYLAELGDDIDAQIAYVDDVTGNVVSAFWNDLSPETQQNIKRTGFFLTAAGGAAVTGIKTAATTIKTSRKITKIKIAKATNGGAGLVRQTHPDHPLTSNALPRNGSREVSSQGGVPTCGQHSCSMLTSSTGQNLNPVDLINQTGEVATNRLDLANLLRGNGVGAASFANRNVDDLARYTQNGTPVITRVTGNNGFSHWVVVDGVTTRQGQRVVAVRDPHGQQYFSPVSTFQSHFSGDVVRPR